MRSRIKTVTQNTLRTHGIVKKEIKHIDKITD